MAIANEVCSPTAGEAEYFQGMLDAYEESMRQGFGAARYRGVMIDAAMIPLARDVVKEYQRRKR